MTRTEKANRAGLVVFWVALIWMIGWALFTAPMRLPLLRTLTLEEYNQTIWAHTGVLGTLFGISVPLGGIVAAIGAFIYAGVRRSAWTISIGVFVVFAVAMMSMTLYIPLLFGIGGMMILLSFMGIVWLWARERKASSGRAATAADLRLVGYLLFLIAAWILCAITPQGFLKALEGLPTMTATSVMIPLALGWLFMFLSHYWVSGSRSADAE